jgi:putative redox protein
MHKILSKWAGKMAFDNHIGHHVVRTDTMPPLGEDSGNGPKSLLLVSLAACSGMDVVSLLQKMRVNFDSLEIDVEGDLTEEHPKVYSHIRMVYRFAGSEIKPDKVEKAIHMSHTRYCGVSAMLSKTCPIDYVFEITDSKEGK